MQFAELMGELTTTGAEQFAKFLNTASSADASQAGQWLGSATNTQVKEAAALLNEGELDEFRDFIGISQGFWAWLFGKRKQRTSASAVLVATAKPRAKPETAKPRAKQATAKPRAKPATSITNCPKCDRKLKYRLESAGKKAKCSECEHLFHLPSSPGKAARAVPALQQQSKTDGDWQALCAYLHERRPAEISTVKEASAVPVVVEYHEAVVADQTCPKLTYYHLKPVASATGIFSYLVVAAGEKSEHDRAWNFKYESILKSAARKDLE